jgi:hypothetical protein
VAARLRPNQALDFEDPQRLANRTAAEAGLIDDVPFRRQRGAFVVAARQNLLAQGVREGIGRLRRLHRPNADARRSLPLSHATPFVMGPPTSSMV